MVSNVCAFCGRPADSVDHLPPKSAMPMRGDDLITVPSCGVHNNARSSSDERFREFLSIALGSDSEAKDIMWSKTLRAMKRDQSRLHSILTAGQRGLDGSFLVPLATNPIKEVLEYITRGLYWRHHGRVLGFHREIDVALLKADTQFDEMLNAFERPKVWSVGDGQFRYATIHLPEAPTITVWLFQFHTQVTAYATTDTVLQRILGRNRIEAYDD